MKVCSFCKAEKNESEFRNETGRVSKRANCKKCDTERHKVWRSKNREHLREYDRDRWFKTDRWHNHIARKYGMSPEEYKNLLSDQNGKCAICSSEVPVGNSKRFHVDHCHKTGVIRGLLCSPCNQMLGYAKDSTVILESALKYLSSRRKQRNS
jgi:hypothetical protein